MNRLRMIAATVALVMVGGLAACSKSGGGSGDEPFQELTGDLYFDGFDAVCGGHAALVDAPAYDGRAPHAIQIMTEPQGNDPTTSLLEPVLPDGRWLGPDGQPVTTFSFDDTQLVACVGRSAQTPAGFDCQYDQGKTAPFYRTAHEITIREARTGRVVATVPVDPGLAGCPDSTKVNAADPKIFGAPTIGQLGEALNPYIFWDGSGTPPAPPQNLYADLVTGTPTRSGSVQLATVAGTDPDDPLVGVLLGFYAAYAAFEEDGPYGETTELEQWATPRMVGSIVDIVRYSQDTTKQGPLHVTVLTVGAQTAQVCVDGTEREEVEFGEPNGWLDSWYRARLLFTVGDDGRYLVDDYADAEEDPRPAGVCPPPAGRVGV